MIKMGKVELVLKNAHRADHLLTGLPLGPLAFLGNLTE